ncbi:MAG: hypothetical protein ACHP7I_05095 [Terriglobales bacterium]
MAVALAPRAVSSDHPRAHPVRKAKPKRIAAVLAPPPVAALHVSYEDGLLSISAQDAPLSDILAQLHQRTGATIDAPADMDDRIAAELGPGPAVQVVAALLEATHFNYLIAGAANRPGAVQSIQLTVKPSFDAEAEAPAPAPEEDRPVAPQSSVKANLTGGDEGVWDDVEVPAATPAPPADTAARPPQ